jgi:putative two-component system response regulator
MSLLNDSNPFILIVDDNPTNLDILIEILQYDYRLSVAKSGKKALEFIQKNPPRLLLLDIMMPEMDGFEVCRNIKSSSTTRHIPVIFISSTSDPASITKLFEVGGADYLTKPFIPLEVKTRVQNQLELDGFRRGE